MYIAMIAKLAGISDNKGLQKVQEPLKQVLNEINKTYENELEQTFSLTSANEFQGLLKASEKTMELLLQFKFRLYPLKIRFGIGFGEVTAPSDVDAVGGTGSAYHVARQMMGEVKRLQSGKKVLTADVQFGHAQRTDCLDALNAGLCLMHFIEMGWTDKQRKNIQESLLLGLTQSEIASKKGLNQSTVHRSLTAAGYYEYQQAYREFQQQINRIWRDES